MATYPDLPSTETVQAQGPSSQAVAGNRYAAIEYIEVVQRLPVGPAGTPGATGATGPTGPVGGSFIILGSIPYPGPPPVTGTEQPGDSWVDSNGDVWGWATEPPPAHWENYGPFRGPTGPTGATGIGAIEVYTQSTAPALMADGIWGDISNPIVPFGTQLTAPDFIQKTGGSMSGPLIVPTPTSLLQAPRWMDGVPRFDTTGARDGAFAAVGGPQPGMKCWVTALKQEQVWNGTHWAPTAGVLPYLFLTQPSGTALQAGNHPMTNATITARSADGPNYLPRTGEMTGGVPGLYLLTVSITSSVETQVSWENPVNLPSTIYGSNGGTSGSTSVLVTHDILPYAYVRKVMVNVPSDTTVSAGRNNFLTLTYVSDF